MNFYETPGLYTDQINPFEYNGLNWPYLHSCGFEWATFQVYNSQLGIYAKKYDLAAVKSHGFSSVGVWGVVYSLAEFYPGGKAIAELAVQMQAQHVIINAEQCLKDTRETQKAQNIINGCRDGGWAGPVSVCTLGPPYSPLVNDYHMDEPSFLKTGGSVHTECYLNEDASFDPMLAKVYWTRVGVPPKQINYVLGLYPGKLGKVSGAQYVKKLIDAGIGKNFSVYLAQNALAGDYDAFKLHIATVQPPLPPPPPPPTVVDVVKINKEIVALCDTYLTTRPGPETKSRLRNIKRIALSSATKWPIAQPGVTKALDDAGIPMN